MSEENLEQKLPEVSEVVDTLVQAETKEEIKEVVSEEAPQEIEEVSQETQEVVQDAPEVAVEAGQSIIVVVGKDKEMNKMVEEGITKLGFEAVLVGAGQDQTADLLDGSIECESFAIVVLSDDDVATPREEFPKNAIFQPRSEEIFLFGFLTAKVGVKNIFVLCKDRQNFKRPSLQDVISYVVCDKDNRWQFDLVRALKASGCEVDANKLI